MFYSEIRILALPDAKRGNLIKPIAFFLKFSMENHILVAFWQWVALKGALFSDFALKSNSAVLSKKLQIAFFQKRLERFFFNSGFKLST